MHFIFNYKIAYIYINLCLLFIMLYFFIAFNGLFLKYYSLIKEENKLA